MTDAEIRALQSDRNRWKSRAEWAEREHVNERDRANALKLECLALRYACEIYQVVLGLYFSQD